MSSYLKNKIYKKHNAERSAIKNSLNFMTKFFIIDDKALFSKEFVWSFGVLLSLFALCIYASSVFFMAFGQEVVSESSAWSGIRRVEQGFFIDPQSAGPSFATTDIRLNIKQIMSLKSRQVASLG